MLFNSGLEFQIIVFGSSSKKGCSFVYATAVIQANLKRRMAAIAAIRCCFTIHIRLRRLFAAQPQMACIFSISCGFLRVFP